MAELIDKMKLLQQIAEFGREIPKDQVMSVIARVPTESSESEKHQLSEEIPTNTPTDLISRQDAIDTLKRVAGVGNRALDALKNIPTEGRPKGKWEIHYNYWNGEECKCSVCGYDVCHPTWNYCPKCGSRNDDVVEV